MIDKIIDFGQYRQKRLEEIKLNLDENSLGTLTVAICDELISINKQLALLKNKKNKAMIIEYNYYYRAKDLLRDVIERIESFFESKGNDSIVVSFSALDCIVGSVESRLQGFILDKNEDNPEYSNLCYLYKKILPLYELHKDRIAENKLNN